MAREGSKIDNFAGDERAVVMANCLMFAVQAFRNKPIFNNKTRKMEGWHTWFKRTLREAGYGEHVDLLERKGK